MTYIIGRARNDMPYGIKIPGTATAVSHNHVKVSENEDGTFTVELCDGAQGLWIVAADGQKTPIVKKRVGRDAKLRLGTEMGIQGYSLSMSAFGTAVQSWAQKFYDMQQKLKMLEAEQDSLELAKIRHQRIRTLSPIVGLALSMVPGVSEQIWTVRASIVLPPLVCGLIFGSDDKKLRELKKERKSVCVCPNCGEELTERDVKKGKCPHCGAC